MKKFFKIFALLAALSGLSLWGSDATAASKFAIASGNWGTNGTWSSVSCTTASATTVPTGTDDVTICPGVTVTMNGNPGAALSLDIQGTATWTQARTTNVGTGGITVTGDISGASNGILTSTGGLTINAVTTSTTVTVTLQTTAAQTINGTGSLARLTVTGAGVTATNTGTLTVGTALSGTGTLTNTGTLNIGGTSGITTLTATAAGNTVNYSGAAQTAKVTTYSNLTLSGSGAKTFATTPTVNGVLSMEGTATVTVTTGVVTYGAANATLQYNTATARTASAEEWITPFNASGGIFITNTGAITMNSAKVLGASVPLTIDTGATLNTNNFQLTFGGSFVNNGTFNAGSSPIIVTNNMAVQSIDGFTTTGLVSMTKTGGTATFADNVNGAGLTINGSGGATLNLGTGLTHTFTGNWTTTAGALNGGSSILNIGGSCSAPPPGATFTAGTGTVNWNAAGAQTVCQYAYYNLGLSGSGAKTMTGVTSIGGNLDISGSATMTGNAAFTVGGTLNYSSSGTTTLTAATPIIVGSFNQTAGTIAAGANSITVSGNWNETGTFISTGTVTFNGSAAQTISGTSPVTYNNLTVTNGANPNITLATNVTVSATLTGTVNLTNTCPTDYTLTSTMPSQVLHSCPTAVVTSINRANSDPTSAATVSWTVTFSKSVSGVDASAFSLVPTGLSGAFITTVTGSGTTWTVTANTGIGSGSLGLNQTGPGSVVPTLSGTFTGQVYTVTATPALAEYRMDEAGWNTTAGQVADSSGNGNNAQAFNSANTTDGSRAIAGSPGTCRYAVFDDGGSITSGYVQTPLPDLTSDFTITAWINTTNNATTGQRIFIDDQNNTGGYGISLGDGGAGLIRFYSRGITPISLDSTYAIASNTWYFVAAVADFANKKRAIYIFNASGTLLNSTSDAAAWTGAWGTDTGPVSIGGEVNGPPQTEPPASFHFHGNLDEVRVYQKVLSQNALAAIATQTHACASYVPDHLTIQSSGSGLTCVASTLTVGACYDASCSIPFTIGVSGTLSATGTPTVNWDGATGGAAGAGFVIPANSSSVTKNMQVATAGTVVLGITAPSPVPTNPTTCNFGSPSCTFTASLAGFIFSDTASPGNVYNVPAQVSGIATPTLYLRAVQASTTNPAVCTPAIINQTVAVNMGYTCNDPASCQSGNLATINATAVASGGTSVTLTFDANASAPITARYDDVGRITLNANKTVTPFTGATAVTLNGSSNAYVVKPDHFVLSGIQQTASPFLVNPAAANSTGSKFVKAGEQFSVTVTAKNALGGTTQNYGQETAPETIKLTPALVVPSSGGTAGTVSGTFGAFAGGAATGTAFTWSDVGIITLTPSVGDGDYLGAGDTTGTTSVNIGRFVPDHFTLTGGSLTNRGAAACAPASSFTYLGEGLDLTFTLTAQNASNGTTQNYFDAGPANGGNFAKLVPGTFASYGVGARSGTTDLTPRISGSVNGSPAWASGVLSNVAARTVVARAASPDGPWSATQFGIAPSDSDGTQLLTSAFDLDVDNNAANDHQKVGVTTELRYGRLRLLNAYGSELLPVQVPLRAEYYSGGSGWKQNTDDSCTVIPNQRNNIALGNYVNKGTSLLSGNMDNTHLSNSSLALSGGAANITIGKPTTAAVGSFDMALNLGSSTSDGSCITWSPAVTTTGADLPWLQFPWCSGKADPNARITFGSSKAPFIYLRETY